MKLKIRKKSQGSVLLVSLVIVTLILTALASYLLLICNENQSVVRSQNWNTCVPVMEAGVEEALTQIHYCGVNNLSSNNWTLGTDGNYHKTRNVGADGSYCKVTIQPVNPPIIYSEAYVPAPVSYQNTYYSSSNFVTREVRVTTKTGGNWGGGLTAKSTITFAGKSLFDSYNSTNGPYNPLINGTNAVALTDTNVAGAISVGGGAEIFGKAVTGPGTGTINTAVSSSGSATIGDVAWNTSGGDKSLSPNAEAGWTANDANFQFNDNSAPFTSGTIPGSGTYLLTSFTYLLNGSVSSKYYLSSLTMTSGQNMMVVGNVTLYVAGNIKLTATSTIYIAPGSSLTLYLGGSMSVNGSGIVNQTGIPANFTVYGLPGCTSINYSGGSAYIGLVDAPEASFSFAGGSGCFGAYIAHDVSIGGTGGIHFDESLLNTGGFVVASWNEAKPQ